MEVPGAAAFSASPQVDGVGRPCSELFGLEKVLRALSVRVRVYWGGGDQCSFGSGWRRARVSNVRGEQGWKCVRRLRWGEVVGNRRADPRWCESGGLWMGCNVDMGGRSSVSRDEATGSADGELCKYAGNDTSCKCNRDVCETEGGLRRCFLYVSLLLG